MNPEKVVLVTDLSKTLMKIGKKIPAKALVALFNNAGIKAENDAPFRGGRGVFTLISKVIKANYDRGDVAGGDAVSWIFPKK